MLPTQAQTPPTAIDTLTLSIIATVVGIALKQSILGDDTFIGTDPNAPLNKEIIMAQLAKRLEDEASRQAQSVMNNMSTANPALLNIANLPGISKDMLVYLMSFIEEALEEAELETQVKTHISIEQIREKIIQLIELTKDKNKLHEAIKKTLEADLIKIAPIAEGSAGNTSNFSIPPIGEMLVDGLGEILSAITAEIADDVDSICHAVSAALHHLTETAAETDTSDTSNTSSETRETRVTNLSTSQHGLFPAPAINAATSSAAEQPIMGPNTKPVTP